MNTRAIYALAKLEFFRLLTHRLVLAVGLFLMLIAFLNGAGGAESYVRASAKYPQDMVLVGLGSSWQSIVEVSTMMAAFLAATTIPYESWKNSLGVLLTKPAHMTDLVLGKFLGMAGFMFLFNAFTTLFSELMIIVFFRVPQSNSEFILRVATYIFLFSLITSVIIALNIFFGAVSKNLLFVTAASISYFFLEWIWYTDRILGSLTILTPVSLFNKIIYPYVSDFLTLFDTMVPYDQWLYGVIPYIGLAFIELLILLMASIFIFSRKETI